nr:hypothetical protein [Helicobacter pylori]
MKVKSFSSAVRIKVSRRSLVKRLIKASSRVFSGFFNIFNP